MRTCTRATGPAYLLTGARGAKYRTLRNRPRPYMLYLVNEKNWTMAAPRVLADRQERDIGGVVMPGKLPEWTPANNGAGKRRWFLIRGLGAEGDPCSYPGALSLWHQR